MPYHSTTSLVAVMFGILTLLYNLKVGFLCGPSTIAAAQHHGRAPHRRRHRLPAPPHTLAVPHCLRLAPFAPPPPPPVEPHLRPPPPLPATPHTTTTASSCCHISQHHHQLTATSRTTTAAIATASQSCYPGSSCEANLLPHLNTDRQ